jgi:hypothetical protein
MSNENPNQEAKFFALYTGVVIDRNDPRKLARVRVRVPGLIDEKSPWALPLGTFGGGYKVRRGFKFVPKVGAEIAVLFKMGDLDHPYYWAGNWGLPEDLTEVPGGGKSPPIADELNAEGEDITAEEAPQIDTIETDSFLISFDERNGSEGKGSLYIRHKLSGDHVEYDGGSNAWIVKATQAVELQSDGVINITANQVAINGRIVRNTTDPI